MCCSSFLKCSLVVILIVGVLIGVLQIWMDNKNYLFSHEMIAEVTLDALSQTKGQSPNATLTKVHSELVKLHGSHILPSSEWVFLNCGGWMGSMYILHASFTEYVLFFGVGIDTSGHSGRYLLKISDTVVAGDMRQWKEGGLNVYQYNIGDTIMHEPGEVTGVQWSSGTIMVEYGRGFIPSSLPYALADTFFSTTDFYLLYKFLKVYTKAFLNEIVLDIEEILK